MSSTKKTKFTHEDWVEALIEYANIPESVPLEPLAVAHYISRLQSKKPQNQAGLMGLTQQYPV